VLIEEEKHISANFSPFISSGGVRMMRKLSTPNSKENQKAQGMDKLQISMWILVDKVDIPSGSTNHHLRLRFPPWSRTPRHHLTCGTTLGRLLEVRFQSFVPFEFEIWFTNHTLHQKGKKNLTEPDIRSLWLSDTRNLRQFSVATLKSLVD
jgi:hypothetical protein